jgi:hypothetical protein
MRWVSALNQAAAERDDVYGCWLVDFHFDSGHVRANDAGISLSFGGNEYAGVGTFGRFDVVEESFDFVARGVRFELGGVEEGLIATLLTEKYQGRPAALYCGLLEKNLQWVDDPELWWSGFMDTMDILPGDKESKESVIVLQCEHRLRSAPMFSRFSDADQKARSPGDRFFEMLHLVAGYTSQWGGKVTRWETGPGGGRIPR